MRAIKGVLFVFSGLFILVTLISLLMPSQAIVIRSVVINANKKDIRQNLADLKQWHFWHPVFSAEGTEISYCDNPIRSESTCCNLTYNGKAAHVEIIKTDSASVTFVFQQNGEADIKNSVTLTNINKGAVEAEWKALTRFKWYPWEKFYGIFIDVMTGPGYDAALQGLKKYSEETAQ